jgi:hypothetical protein
MNNQHSIKTGDVLLFSGNAPGGFLVRTFVSSMWNHVGIAVRVLKLPDPNNMQKFIYKISLTEEGELYVYETNTYSRLDDILGDETTGPGFTHYNFIFSKYNRVAVRKLNDVFRTEKFASLIWEFAEFKKYNKFPKSGLPFLAVWLGISLKDNNLDDDMFCSELTAFFYLYCVGKQYEEVTNTKFDGQLKTLFGSDSPTTGDKFTPGHYAANHTPNACIFFDSETDVYTNYADFWSTIICPIIFAIILIVIVFLTLPNRNSIFLTK